MSFRKKGRKFRTKNSKVFPISSGKISVIGNQDFIEIMAETLQDTFGGSGVSAKIVMAYTGAGERTVKNWFEGKNGPNGKNLVELARHSDPVLEAFLWMAGREDILAGKILVDARDVLVEMLETIHELQSNNSAE